MANQIQATVYQIDGNPLPSPIVISFLTSDIMMRKNAIPNIPEVSSSITYYPNTSNQLQEQTFYVSEELGKDLFEPANVGGTTQVSAQILEIDGDPQVPGGVGFTFPANGISIWPSVNPTTGVNSFIEFKNKRYYAQETEIELTAQANVNNALPYKVYTAFVSQSGTNDPVVETIFENTIGEIVWTRTLDAGIYYATSDDLFTEDKTFVLLTLAGGNDVILYGQRISDSTVGVYSDTLTESVELNGQFQIEIRVYN